jgi:leucyl aminopeptidase (aminopeptidase T)
MAALLDKADVAEVTTPAGTAMKFGLVDRPGKFMTGDLTQSGVIDNLPAGEAFIVPLEGTAEGLLVVEAGWLPGLAETMTLVFERFQVLYPSFHQL